MPAKEKDHAAWALPGGCNSPEPPADGGAAARASAPAAGAKDPAEGGLAPAGSPPAAPIPAAPASRILCVTARKLCPSGIPSFLEQVERIAQAGPLGIILREKDLTEEAYFKLLLQCRDICRLYQVPLFAHTFVDAAKKAGILRIHLSLPVFIKLGRRPQGFHTVGTSIHSLDEAKKAVDLGADYLTAGHIFETDCKAGLPGRGLAFLEEICHFSPVPVYAIGGITPKNMPDILKAGAAGGCMMSSLMTAKDPGALMLISC